MTHQNIFILYNKIYSCYATAAFYRWPYCVWIPQIPSGGSKNRHQLRFMIGSDWPMGLVSNG